MTWEAWLTLAVLVAAIVAMIRQYLSPTVAVLGGTIVLYLARVIDTEQAFGGFANPAPLTIAVLYVIAAAFSKTGALGPVVGRTLPAGAGSRSVLARLLPPVTVASSFLNNTPIVAVLVPEVGNWAARHGKSVSRFLMPVSFAAILGGVVTLIGTSTNLVVSGLLEDAGFEPLGFFELSPLGVPLAIGGLAVLVALAPRLLPDRSGTREELTELAREFVVDMEVVVDGPLDGVTVRSAGLRDLAGVFLVQVHRGNETVAPVSPETTLYAGDRLRFAGKADDVVDLHSMPGLASGEREQFVGFDLTRSSFFEAVVGASSGLVGRTLKQAQFRSTYQAAVVAIHRAGHRVDAKLGDVTLRVGDTLVVLADPGFRHRWRDRADFLLVSPLSEGPPVLDRRRYWVMGIMVGVVVLAATNVMPILHAALIGAIAVVLLRILSPGDARNAVDVPVILLIGGAFGLAEAMVSSGLAGTLADAVVSIFGGLGGIGALAGVVIATILLTEMVSNVAAAAVVLPIAVAAAQSLDLDPRAFAIAVAFAASASFLTPVGYQTNTMVYGPGGYRYTDYARLGAPITAFVAVGIVVGVPLVWPL